MALATLEDRQTMTKAFAQRYQQSSKPLAYKGVKTIYEFGTSKKKRSKRSRTRVYDERVDKTLKQLWYIADGICG